MLHKEKGCKSANDVHTVSGSSNRSQLPAQLARDLREQYPNVRKPPDGLIYQKIRYYQGHLDGPRDGDAEQHWWAILESQPRSKKSKYLQQFLKHSTLPQAFDGLLTIPGLWAGMQFGTLHKLIALRCDEVLFLF